MSDLFWTKLVEASPTLGLALAGWIAVQVQNVLGQLRTLNGSTRELKGQLVGHEALDDLRFEALQRQVEHLERGQTYSERV